MSKQAADDCGNEQNNERGSGDGDPDGRTFEEAARDVRRAKKLGKHDYEGKLPDPYLPSIDTVPDTLMDAPWMCWAFEWDEGDELTKVPRHGEGARNWAASVTESDNWTDVKTAFETAREKGWGVGPVFTAENDLIGIDIDDGRDSANNEPTEMAQDVIDRLDTWTEVSVSGTDFHPIALGEVPDGGSKGDVEMYDDARFFAFTGQHVEGTPDDIRVRPDEVKDIHDEYVMASSGTVEGKESGQTDETAKENTHSPVLDDETAAEPNPDPVQDIKDTVLVGRAINADDGGYFEDLWRGKWQKHTHRWKGDSQSEGDMALCQKLAFWTGGDPKRIDRLFRESSLYRDKWDEPHYSNGDTYGERTIEEAIENQDEFYSPNRSRGGASSNVNPGVSEPEPGTHGFETHNGGYGYWDEGDEDTGASWVGWTNFEIEVESFLSIKGDTEKMELTVHPRNGKPYNVTVEPTVFNEPRAFRREVACGRTTTFTGGGKALAKVKQFVGTQTAPELTGVRQMCRRDGRLVLPGGSLTADGWEEEPTHRYIKQDVGIERKTQLTPDNDEYDEDDVRSILELLPQTRDPERFLPAVGWFYATPIRPVITDEEGEFPILSITGGTGAGKTSTLETMWELFGVNGDPFSANGTTFSSMRMVSSTDSLPVWFDEYKPSDISDGRLDGFHDLVRKSTKGGVISKGNADQTTTEHHLRAPVVVSGEQRFAGPAEQRRSVLATFKEETADPTGEHAHAYAQLTGGSYRMDNGQIEHYDGCDLTGHAMAYHQWLLGFSDEEIVERWHDAEKRVLDLLDTYGLGDVDSAGRVALQTIVLGIRLYRAFADEYGASVPFDVDDEDRALTYVAKQQGEGGRRESHLDEFIRLLSLTAMDDEIEDGRHYTETGGQKTGDREIRVHMGKTYPKVAQYVQNHGLHKGTELLDEQDYRERIKEQVEVDDSYITCYSQNTVPINRSFGIHVQRAEKVIEAFDREHFYGEKDETDWANRKTEKIG